MAISGDGSQANPWIVHNWEEFSEVNVSGSGGTYLKFADGGGIIDFNTINPDGYTSALNIYPHIDGNGWVWRNIYLKSAGIVFLYSVSNLKLLNVYFVGSKNPVIKSDDTANNITISGVFNSTSASSMVPFGAANGAFRSSFNYKSRGTNFVCCILTGLGYAPKFTQCQFHLDVVCSQIAYISYTTMSGAYINNCLFTGQISGSGLSSTQGLLPNNASSVNNVLDVTVKPTVTQGVGNISAINLYNTDKITFSNTSSYVVGLNTSQLADADTIAATGFPIGV